MLRFVTDYRADDGKAYSFFVDAIDQEHAQQQCDARRPGETVSGVLHMIAAADGFSHAKAGAACRAFADQDDDSAPSADEFPPIDAMGMMSFAELGGSIEGEDR